MLIISYRKIPVRLTIPSKMEPIGNLPNPLDFTPISTTLNIPDDSTKIDTHTLLKCSVLMINEKHPEEEHLRVYTHGSKIEETGTGAGVYCHLFSNYVSVGRYKMNFHKDTEAIFLALQQLIYHPNTFQKAVLMVDSQAAIQVVPSNKQQQSANSETSKVSQQTYHAPIDSGQRMGQGNEISGKLAKKGTGAVSYTHLDVYKRQVLLRAL